MDSIFLSSWAQIHSYYSTIEEYMEDAKNKKDYKWANLKDAKSYPTPQHSNRYFSLAAFANIPCKDALDDILPISIAIQKRAQNATSQHSTGSKLTIWWAGSRSILDLSKASFLSLFGKITRSAIASYTDSGCSGQINPYPYTNARKAFGFPNASYG